MTSASALPRVALAFALALATASTAYAIDIGRSRSRRATLPSSAAARTCRAQSARLQTSDIIKTGADGASASHGDNSLLSAGPNSILRSTAAFDATTNRGGSSRRCARARYRWSPAASPEIAGRDDSAHAPAILGARHGVRRPAISSIVRPGAAALIAAMRLHDAARRSSCCPGRPRTAVTVAREARSRSCSTSPTLRSAKRSSTGELHVRRRRRRRKFGPASGAAGALRHVHALLRRRRGRVHRRVETASTASSRRSRVDRCPASS